MLQFVLTACRHDSILRLLNDGNPIFEPAWYVFLPLPLLPLLSCHDRNELQLWVPACKSFTWCESCRLQKWSESLLPLFMEPTNRSHPIYNHFMWQIYTLDLPDPLCKCVHNFLIFPSSFISISVFTSMNTVWSSELASWTLWSLQDNSCHTDWCSFYYSMRNSPVALLEALFAANIFEIWDIVVLWWHVLLCFFERKNISRKKRILSPKEEYLKKEYLKKKLARKMAEMDFSDG